MKRSIIVLLFLTNVWATLRAQRQMEYLDRGVVAVRNSEGNVFVSWRSLVTDADNIGFNVYCAGVDGKRQKLNKTPVTKTTSFIDPSKDTVNIRNYYVTTVINGHEGETSKPFALRSTAPYFSIALSAPAAYSPNDGSVS